jgi:cytochrome c oxidase subunit IV
MWLFLSHRGLHYVWEREELIYMSWVIPYCVLVFAGLTYCLIHDTWVKRRNPKNRGNTHYYGGLRH